MMEQANEIQESLSRTYGMPELDDADLDAGRCILMKVIYRI